MAPAPKVPQLCLSNASKKSWEDARAHRSVQGQNLLPPSVRKGYRLTKDDWAYLGAVRRPDPLLAYLCPKFSKPSAKGVPVISGHKNLVSYASHLQDHIQSSAHTMRPLSHAVNGLFCYKFAVAEAREAVMKGDGAKVLSLLDQVDGLSAFTWAAMEDTADCLARSNADAVRKLRSLWLDHADLPSEVREGIKQVPVVRGLIPPERNVEYSAPVCGDELQRFYDEAYSRSKATRALHSKQGQFRAPQVKRKNPQQGGGQPKKAKSGSHSSQSRQQSGRGGAKGTSRRPRRGHSSSQQKRGGGKGKQGGKQPS